MFGWAVLMCNLQKSTLEHNLANNLIFLCLLYTFIPVCTMNQYSVFSHNLVLKSWFWMHLTGTLNSCHFAARNIARQNLAQLLLQKNCSAFQLSLPVDPFVLAHMECLLPIRVSEKSLIIRMKIKIISRLTRQLFQSLDYFSASFLFWNAVTADHYW